MKNKVFLILLFLAIIGIGLLYQQSYSKYIKNMDSNVNINMAKWSILVNNEDITNNNTLSQEIPVFFPKTEFYNENVIAPGATGYFDITIDPSNVDVAFSYNLSGNVATEDFPDLKILGYKINPTVEQEMQLYDEIDGILGTLKPKDPSTTVRIYVQWYDDAGNLMENSTDTSYAKNNTNVKFIMNIKLTQLKN